MNRRGGRLAAALAAAVIGAGVLAVSLVWVSDRRVPAAAARGYVTPGSRAAGLAACVEPTGFMRRKHMALLGHQRVVSVHQGIRATRYSLAGCIACHVSVTPQGQPRAIDGPDQFCGACHAFSAVSVDCFDCHAGVPNGGPVSEAALAAQGSD
jgi:hypothetical protein